MRHCLLFTFLILCLSTTGYHKLSAQTIWHPTTIPTTGTLRGVSIPGGDIAIAVGDSGAVLRSSNNGQTWTRRAAGMTDNALQGVSFGTELTGTASGDGGTILHTTDAGETWDRQTVTDLQWPFLRPFFLNADFGVIPANNIMLITYDGGNNWKEFLFPNGFIALENPTAVAFHMFDTNDGLALVRTDHQVAGAVMQTMNSAYAWEGTGSQIQFPRLLAIAFATRRNGFAVGEDGIIVTTTTGGGTWQPFYTGDSATLRDIAFGDGIHGIAVGDLGRILSTSDGGFTWSQQWADTSYNFSGVAYRDGVAIVVGSDGNGDGVILRRTDAAGDVPSPSETSSISLDNIIPNPAHSTAAITYSIAHSADVQLSVIDVLGREISVLSNGHVQSGRHTTTIDVDQLSTGSLFIRLVSGSAVMVRPLVIVR